MTRKRVKLAWIANEYSRSISLKKRRLGLLKKVRELTILCDVKACMIIFSPGEAEPMAWPSIEVARNLLDEFFALPDIEKRKKETTIESYLKEKTRKVHDQLKKSHKKKMEYMLDQLMVQLHLGRRITDLNLSEIYALLSFSRDKIISCRKRLDFIQHPILRDPPMYLFEAEAFKTTRNDVFIGSGQSDERTRQTDETPKRISISTLRENKSHYLMDQWFFTTSELCTPILPRQIGMDTVYYNENPNPRSYLSYQGSSSNGNPNSEMEPVGHQMMTFHDFVGSVSAPLQHKNNDTIMGMSQLRQYPFDFMSRELGVKAERSNINNGFNMNNNTIPTNYGFRQEPPSNGTPAEEGNANVMSLDINKISGRN